MSQEHYARIADLYDEFVRSDYDVDFFVEEAEKADGDVLELMAGTGRLTLPLLEAGISVWALDYSSEMLDVLRDKLAEKDLSAEVREADARTMQLGRQFRQIIIPFQAFPEITTENGQEQALQRVHEHLTDDGLFICTLHNPQVRFKSIDGQLRLAAQYETGDGGTLMVWLLQRHLPDTMLVDVLEFFEMYDARGIMQSKRFSRLQFHLMEKARFEGLIERTGFEGVQINGDYDRSPYREDSSPYMIWMLRRA